ncbi:hypothetical protein ACOMHN_028600 [Nucella lapillus]
MSKFSVVFALFASLGLFVIAHGRAAETEEQQRHRAKRYDMADEMGEYPANDEAMMQRIFRTPLKRQWCRSGMVYNPALGTCTLSLMAMRGRGRSFRRV